jgi:hypothetical protein
MEPRTLRDYLPGGTNGRILITSRNPNWHSLGRVLALDVFSEQEAADFWAERLGQSSDAAGRNELARPDLAQELGRLPLALEHAAAYILENNLNPAAYLSLYRAQRRELWQRTKPPDDYQAVITTTWELAFEQARETPGAAELLNLCCFLAPDDIPLALLREQAAALITRRKQGWIPALFTRIFRQQSVALPAELADVLADDLALNAAVSALKRYSLLSEPGGLLSLHRLVQVVARDRRGEERARKWAEAAMELVYQALPDWQSLHEWKEGGQGRSPFLGWPAPAPGTAVPRPSRPCLSAAGPGC